HHDAQVSSRTFFPRKSESECSRPFISGSLKSGAMSELMKAFCTSGRGPKYHTSFSRAIGWRNIRANSLRLNHVIDRRLERKAVRRAFGIGKQSSSRQTPCGLITKPVARFKSSKVTHKSSAESGDASAATSVVRLS